MDAKLKALIEPVIEGMGFELVRINFGGNAKPILQIMAERPDGTLTIDDCQLISKELSTILDVEDPISGEYALEVSSPGIDRPLTRLKDFDRYKGFDAKVQLLHSDTGRRRYQGLLQGTEDGKILLLTEEGTEESLDFENIKSAKLLLTDALLAAHKG